MKYLLVNASPRGKESNSQKLLEKIKEGMQRSNTVKDADITMMTLRSHLKKGSWQSDVKQADSLIIAFPLYADHVPGILKQWIEDLGPMGLKKKKLGWITQCGFPESIHLEYVEKYCHRATELLGAEPMGVVKKAGVEGIRLMPPSMNQKLFSAFQDLGHSLIAKKQFDLNIISQLAKPRTLNFFSRFIFRIMNFLGLANFYWNMNLKKNKAYNQRFAKPYAP